MATPVGLAAGPALAQQATVVVSPAAQQQPIDGFGASSAWTAPFMTPTDPNTALAFSIDGGAGLSLLRIRIAPCTVAADNSCAESTLETVTAQTAQAMGVKVWATPWTPPAAWKSNDSTQDGGTLLAQYEDDWAQALVGFVQMMNDAGVPLVGVSAQNEPTQAVDYDSCTYTPETLAEFVGNHMGPAFQDAGLLGDAGMPFGIIAPETVQGDSNFSAFSTQILDTNATGYVGTIATHSYGQGPPYDPTVAMAGKEYWETEVYDEEDVAALDAGTDVQASAELASALWVATTANSALVKGGVNAWHYWWLYGYQGGNEGLFNLLAPDFNTAVPTKRLYALGNYSRFVRPGFFLVTATQYPANNVYVSAFYDPPSAQIVLVAVNTTGADAGAGTVPVTFLFNGATTGSWTSWVTSATQNLEPGDPVTGGTSVAYTLQPQSVTTLVGEVTGPGPAVSPEAATSPTGGQVTVTTAADGGILIEDTAATDPAGAAPGCGLACSTVGRVQKTDAPWRLALGVSLGACMLARWRSRRRRPRGHSSDGGSSSTPVRREH